MIVRPTDDDRVEFTYQQFLAIGPTGPLSHDESSPMLRQNGGGFEPIITIVGGGAVEAPNDMSGGGTGSTAKGIPTAENADLIFTASAESPGIVIPKMMRLA
jgi:hypothetical protein